MFLNISQSLFNKVADNACNFIKKETLPKVFSCDFCEIFKNIFSYRTTPVVVSSSSKFISFSTSCQRWHDNGCSSVPLASASSPPWYLAPPNSHMQKSVIPECIGMEMLFSFQTLTRNWKIKSGVFASQRNFKQTFV